MSHPRTWGRWDLWRLKTTEQNVLKFEGWGIGWGNNAEIFIKKTGMCRVPMKRCIYAIWWESGLCVVYILLLLLLTCYCAIRTIPYNVIHLEHPHGVLGWTMAWLPLENIQYTHLPNTPSHGWTEQGWQPDARLTFLFICWMINRRKRACQFILANMQSKTIQ